MGRPKPFHTRGVHERREYPKQMARKISSEKASKKKSAEVEYDFCGCCPKGLVVYPESIEDVLETDCHYAFRENFEMFLRKQKDKNTETDMQFKLEHEERMRFASMTVKIGKGSRCFECKSEFENYEKQKFGTYFLAMVGRKFISRPDRSNYNWPDDLLLGFDEADALITHLKDLNKDFGHKNLNDLSIDSVKAIKKDLVVSGYRWVVEQLNAALEEFKEFRDGLDENEREKWDKSVVKQSEKYSDFEMESFESYEEECERFEKVDTLIKELHKEMDHIIARYNNRNKAIDSLVELIEGNSLGAVPKKKKENNSKSRKKKNSEINRKDVIKHAKKESELNVNSQQLEVKLEEFEFDTSSIDIENLKPCEASLITLDTELKLLDVQNHVEVEVSQNANFVPMMKESPNVGASEENFNMTFNNSSWFITNMQNLIDTEVDKADPKKMEEEFLLTNSVERMVSTDESELLEREEVRSIRVKSNLTPKYLILEKHEKCQNVKEQKSGDTKDGLMNKLEAIQKEPVTNAFSSDVENGEYQIVEVGKDTVVNEQILIDEVKKDRKRDKISKPNCAREACLNKGRHKCSRCKAVFYCAQDCLNEDWPYHKMFCDYVFKANKVPDDSTNKKLSEVENSGDREEVD